MQVPLEISFRNMEPSEAVETRVREKADKLERLFDRIISCEVTVEAPHRHHHKGKHYEVHINLNVPGTEIVAKRTGPVDHAHEDVYIAIRDSFAAAERQLEDYVRKMRGDVKAHAR